MVLALDQLAHDHQRTAQQLAAFAEELREQFTSASVQMWHGYRSPTAEVLAVRCLGVADAFYCAVAATTDAEAWTNFDAALVDLASVLALTRAALPLSEGSERVTASLQALIDAVLTPKLGPVLEQAVGRRRVEVVLGHYIAMHGEDEIARSLRALQQVVSGPGSVSSDESGASAIIAARSIHPAIAEVLDQWLAVVAHQKKITYMIMSRVEPSLSRSIALTSMAAIQPLIPPFVKYFRLVGQDSAHTQTLSGSA